MFNWLKRWLKRGLKEPFTVACDQSPFWTPLNERETLIRVNGLWRARHQARKWISRYTNGQSRLLKGWHYWPEENEEVN
jgi:hypothetical protein